MNENDFKGRNQLKRRIAVGVWEDMDGNLHLSEDELLDMVDLPKTPENRDELRKLIRMIVSKEVPTATLVERRTPWDMPPKTTAE